MIDLIKEHNIVDSVKVEEYKNQKRIKLSKWSNIMEVI
jgi:hypothetical protein